MYNYSTLEKEKAKETSDYRLWLKKYHKSFDLHLSVFRTLGRKLQYVVDISFCVFFVSRCVIKYHS